MSPRTIVLDFDGVLNSYVSGWQGAVEIPDPPTDGAQDFVRRLLDDGWEVVVCSTRAETSEGAAAISVWLADYGFPVGQDEGSHIARICHGKPPALVYLDDRALRFDGVWPTTGAIEDAATPWMKRMQGRT